MSFGNRTPSCRVNKRISPGQSLGPGNRELGEEPYNVR